MSFKRMTSVIPHHEGKAKAIEDHMAEGKKVTFNPRDLNVVWGKDSRYWDVPDGDAKPAELLQVCWLEVTGTATNINPKKEYEVIFKLSLKPDAFGWSSCPVYVMVKRGKDGKFAPKKYQLTNFKESPFEISCRSKLRADKENQESKDLYFGLYEVWSGKWKGGLQIHSAIVKEL